MDELCETMNELIINYINKDITEEDKLKLMNHLNICSQCRKELALTLNLSQIVSNQIKEVPQEVMDNMFSKIPKECENESHKTSFMEPYLYARKVISSAISTTKKSIRLALQFI